MKTAYRVWLIVLSIAVWSPVSLAASSQADGALHFPAEKILAFAKKVEKVAAAKGARVFIVSRVGRPKSKLPPGFNYTHTGIAVYSVITTEDGRKIPGYTMYNLYQEDEHPNRSHLVTDYPVDFYSGVFELKSGVIIPKPSLQKKILRMLASQEYKTLHNDHYSAISNPFTNEYQNCTEYTLDIINAAIYDTLDIEQIKANNKKYFEPQPVKVNPFKMMLGSIFSSEIALSDHPDDVSTATYTTIARYLKKYGLVQEELTILPD